MNPVDLADKFALFNDQWSPRVIAEMNDYQFKLVRLQGDFVWHQHDDTDEVFIVLEGEIEIDFEEISVPLRAGQMLVVPKGVRHCPRARDEAKVLLVEPRGVVNTGDAESELTADNDQWI